MATPTVDESEKVTFEPFDNPMQAHYDEHLKTQARMIRVMPHNFIVTHAYENYHEKFVTFPGQSTDVWVASYPKAGTTWTQQLVWGLVRGLEHKDTNRPLMERFPFFEWDSLFDPAVYEEMLANLPENNVERPGVQWRILTEEVPSPRLIKSHLVHGLLPRDARRLRNKIVYVMRDPRDVCVSLFYHTVKFLDYTGTFDDFVDIFLHDAYELGPYWSNMLSYWRLRDQSNLLIVRYEQLKQDLSGTIEQVAKFLDVSVPPESVAALCDHLSFASMKSNPGTNNETIMQGLGKPSDIKFMRKGIVGDYMNHLSAAQIKRFKEWNEKWLKDSDFPYYRD